MRQKPDDAFRQQFGTSTTKRLDRVEQTDLVAVWDELLQGAHLLVDPVPSPLQRTHARSKVGQ
jgi:hypothetical protein